MQESFLKWMELCLLCHNTPAVTQTVTDNIIFRHGCPEIIVSDNGTPFKFAQFEKFLAIIHTEAITRMRQRTRCNSVERTNRTIKTIRCESIEVRMSESRSLEQIQFAYNSTWHDTTRYTSVYLNLGLELLSPANAKNTRQGRPYLMSRRHLEEAKSWKWIWQYYDLRRRFMETTSSE